MCECLFTYQYPSEIKDREGFDFCLADTLPRFTITDNLNWQILSVRDGKMTCLFELPFEELRCFENDFKHFTCDNTYVDELDDDITIELTFKGYM
jgi:hypothetical protein